MFAYQGLHRKYQRYNIEEELQALPRRLTRILQDYLPTERCRQNQLDIEKTNPDLRALSSPNFSFLFRTEIRPTILRHRIS